MANANRDIAPIMPYNLGA